jgi:hypothetical protein
MKSWFRMSVRNKTLAVFPDSSRYAVGKATVVSRQAADGQGLAKREKEIRQAMLLFEALQQTRRSADLALVCSKVWEHRPVGQENVSNRNCNAPRTRCQTTQDSPDRGFEDQWITKS